MVIHLLQQEKVGAIIPVKPAAGAIETTKPSEDKEFLMDSHGVPLENICQTSILCQQVVSKWHIVARGKIFIVLYFE